MSLVRDTATWTHRAATLLLALLLASSWARADEAATRAAEALSRYPQDRVYVESAGKRFPFTVWIADTPERRTQGLMYVRSLAPDRGMLFLFPSAAPQAFWMKNTYVSLDILFIAADGRILSIATQAKPRSLATIESRGAVLGVLEVLAGTAERLGWRTGDFVAHPAFGRPNS